MNRERNSRGIEREREGGSRGRERWRVQRKRKIEILEDEEHRESSVRGSWRR